MTLLTTQQQTLLKTDILADPVFSLLPPTSDSAFQIADGYKVIVVPTFWVWRTEVSRSDVYNLTSDIPSNWNWTTYKNQAVGEQGAWTQIFMGDRANFGQANVRAGVSAIFTGSAQANAQAAHVLAVSRRAANRIEKLLATGTGSTASPATMTFEGNLNFNDVITAMGWQ